MLAKSIMLLFFLVIPLAQATKPLLLAISDYPPYEYSVNGKIEGLSVEVVEAVFKSMEQPVELIHLPFSRILKYLENGQIDGGFQLLITGPRQTYTDFSREVLVNETIAGFALADTPLVFSKEFKNLTGLRVVMLQDFSYGSIIDNGITSGMFKDVVRLTNATDMFLVLASKQADLVIGDIVSTRFYFNSLNNKHQFPMIKKHTADIQVIPTYMAFSAKNKLKKVRDAFDSQLRLMKLNGSYDKIIERWHDKLPLSQ
jgi:polar amino acid transport system substrate-binding protein